MPFTETDIVDERTRFIEDAHRSLHSFTWLCSNTGSAARWRTHGPEVLRNRSSRPMHCPWATPPEVVEAILGVRRTYTDYGAKKIRWYLEKYRAELVLPSRTTIHNILCRHDLVPKRRRRTRRWHPGRPGTVADVPNRSWSADFKGDPDPRRTLLLSAHRQDMHSRFLLDCRGRAASALMVSSQCSRAVSLGYPSGSAQTRYTLRL